MIKAGLVEQYLSALVEAGEVSQFIRLSQNMNAMLKQHELELFDVVKDHVRKHGKLPSPDTCADEYGFEVVPVDEPASFYQEKIRARFIRLTYVAAVNEVNARMKDDPFKAQEHFEAVVSRLGVATSENAVSDLRDAIDYVYPAYRARWRGGDGGVEVGWSTMDAMSGGFGPGDVVSIVGRPEQGKTQLLLWCALHACKEQHLPVMFVSLEMDTLLIEERCVAVWTSVPLSEIRHLRGRSLLQKRQRRFKAGMLKMREHDAPFHVVDGNMGSTVAEIHMLAKQFRPAAIYIDGAYLLQHPDGRLPDNHRVNANSRMIKRELATGLQLPVFCTYQFNREGSRRHLREGQAPGMENIAGGDAISQDSSVILALVEEDTIETHWEREVTVLKGRGGESGRFSIRWDWEQMDFRDLVDVPIGTAEEFGVD